MKPKKSVMTASQRREASKPGAFMTRKGGPIRNSKDERQEDFGSGGLVDLYAKSGRGRQERVAVVHTSHRTPDKPGRGISVRTVSRKEAEKMKQISHPKSTKKKAKK